MSSITPHRRHDLVIAIAAVGLALLYIGVAGGGFPLDDSWIHQTYGRNLAQFGEWAYTPGIPSTASTSPLYTLLLAFGYRLGVPYAVWTHGLGIICLIAAGLIGARMAERLLPQHASIGLWAGLAVVGAWHLIWAATSGMETMVFSLSTLILIWLSWRELDNARSIEKPPSLMPYAIRGALFGLAAGLATLARPEGLLLVGMIGLAVVVARPGMTCFVLIVWGAAALLACGLALAPYLAFNLQVTGGLLPNTAASKRADLGVLFLTPYLVRVFDLIVPLTAGGQVLLIPGGLAFLLHRLRALRTDRRQIILLVPLAWSAGLILLYAAYLPAYFQHGRYVMPALPSFIVCGAAGTALLIHQSRRHRIGRIAARVLSLATAALFAAFAVTLGLQAYAADVEIIDSEMVRSAHWLADNLPADNLLAVHDIGAVGYFAPRPIIDLAGLVNPELLPIIPVENNGEAVWNMLRERDARYVMGFADQLPGGDPNDGRLCPVFRARGADAEVSDTYNMTIYRIAWDEQC